MLKTGTKTVDEAVTAFVYCLIMPRLITSGPDIPKNILQKIRNDNLVFFCGAGISFYQNKLPLFKKLVRKVSKKLNINIDKEPLLSEAWNRKNYDIILDLIEGSQSFSVPRKRLKFSVPRKRLRREIINILNNFKGKPNIHKALLDLSALSGNRGHRLVTTNFDRLFFEAGLDLNLSDSAPKLAPPRKETWKNLTFLHGIIDEKYDPDGDNLILTRRDFGLAYLYDNWASRFMIQLFQEFTILFIGYGVNDPVINYLVSTLSYENHRRKQNETNTTYANSHESNNADKVKPSIYAFAEYNKEDEKEQAEDEWRSIGVEPILYKITTKADNSEDHSLLYRTIQEWADRKKEDLEEQKNQLREKLKLSYNKETDKEKANKVISSLQINEELAQYFSRIDFASEENQNHNSQPIKPVDIRWLKAFSVDKDNRYKNPMDLPSSESHPKEDLLKNLIPPPQKNQRMWKGLSVLEQSLAQWLCCYLHKEELVHWMIDRGCTLHPDFKQMIQYTINKTNNSTNNDTLLTKQIRLFWETIANDSYSTNRYRDYYIEFHIIQDLNKEYSKDKANILLDSLNPYIQFNESRFSKSFYKENPDFPKQSYEPEITVKMDTYPTEHLTNEDVLLRHAESFSDLLKKAMELAKQFEIIKKNGEDPFCVARHSIEQHTQNTKSTPWTYLIDLTRDSFDLAMQKDKKLAMLLLQKWQYYPYSLFYRLILYAVTQHPDDLNEKTAVDLLANEENCVLWSRSCKNEVFKYLRYKKHSTDAVKKLFSLIMKGPPDTLFKENLEEQYITELKEIDIYRRLNCLKVSGVFLPKEIEKYYNEIQSKYQIQPLKNKADERYDFPYFHTGIRSIPINKGRYHHLTPQEIYNDFKKTDG